MKIVNMGEAKTTLSKLVAAAEAGEEIHLARNGAPVVKIVAVDMVHPGERILASWGKSGVEISPADDFEYTEQELDEMYSGEDLLI